MPSITSGRSWQITRGFLWVLTQHITLNWFSRNVKREVFKVRSVTAAASSIQTNLSWRSLKVCKKPWTLAVLCSLRRSYNSFRKENFIENDYKNWMSCVAIAKQKWFCAFWNDSKHIHEDKVSESLLKLL